MKLIKVKKYSNRKLYIDDSGMVNIKDLKNMIRSGIDITVTSHENGDDITKQTMLSMLDSDQFSKQDLINLVRK